MSTMTPPRPSELRLCRVRQSAGPAAAATARRQVEAVIAARNFQVDQGVAVLLTSELAAHAIRHETSGTVTLTVSCSDDQLRVDVHDTSVSVPTLVDPPADAEHGRGLLLVDAMSAGWGTLASAGPTPPAGGCPTAWEW